MLLLHADLTAVLEKSWRAVSREKAETTSFHVAEGWQDEPTFRCPDCGQTMEKYGYMGIGAIEIDRCEPCTLVWLDADELQNMVLALAQSNYRSVAAWQESLRERVDISQAAATAGVFGGQWLFDKNSRGVIAVEALLSLLLR